MPDYDYVGPYSPEYYELPVSGQYYDDYQPWWYDLGIEAIRRGSETAQVIGAGWPSIPQIPQPTPTPQPGPQPGPAPGVQPQPQGGLSLSTNTLIILGLVGFAFVFGSRRR